MFYRFLLVFIIHTSHARHVYNTLYFLHTYWTTSTMLILHFFKFNFWCHHKLVGSGRATENGPVDISGFAQINIQQNNIYIAPSSPEVGETSKCNGYIIRSFTIEMGKLFRSIRMNSGCTWNMSAMFRSVDRDVGCRTGNWSMGHQWVEWVTFYDGSYGYGSWVDVCWPVAHCSCNISDAGRI